MTTEMKKERARRMSGEERRVEAVEALIGLAADQDPGSVTTAEIAGRMGVTQGALFRHFPTKSAVMEAAMRWVGERLMARVDRVAGKAISPLAVLEAIFHAHVDFVSAHPGIPRMLFGELQRSKETPSRALVREMLSAYGRRLQRLLEEGKAAGELDEALDVRVAAGLLIGTVQGLVIQSLLAGGVGRMRRDAPGVFAIYKRGIRKKP